MTTLHPASPVRPVSLSVHGSPLRKKTPSPKKRTLDSPLSASPTPTSFWMSRISSSREPRTVPQSTEPGESHPRDYAREVYPGFCLFDNGKDLGSPTVDQFRKLRSLFPNCSLVEHCPPFIRFHFTELPPRPWPLKIAGLIAWFTMETDIPPPNSPGTFGRGPSLMVDVKLIRWELPTMDVIRAVGKALMEQGCEIEGLQWWNWLIVVELAKKPTEDELKRFPRRINQITVSYVFDTPFKEALVLRLRTPTDAEPDDDVYHPMLRPGVMLGGTRGDGAELSTTSGVCVKSSDGQKFITCATHGFLFGSGDVYHPHVRSHNIGTIVRTFGTSDISLFKLAPGLKYSRESFGEVDYEGRAFRRIVDLRMMRTGDFIYMNTPFNGHCEGTYVAARFGLLPSDEPGQEHTYFVSTIGYFGQHSDRILDGACGAPVWTKEFDIIGQFRFTGLKSDKFAYMPSFEQLKAEGFELGQID